MAAGGVTYSAGVLIYLNQKLPYRRAIWHGIVVIGAGLHYAAILTGVVLSGA
jgi:hemolysin III